jgi:hypothetical protein
VRVEALSIRANGVNPTALGIHQIHIITVDVAGDFFELLLATRRRSGSSGRRAGTDSAPPGLPQAASSPSSGAAAHSTGIHAGRRQLVCNESEEPEFIRALRSSVSIDNEKFKGMHSLKSDFSKETCGLHIGMFISNNNAVL